MEILCLELLTGSLEEVGCKNLKTLGTQPPQECPDTYLPEGLKSGEALSKIGASPKEVGGGIPKTLGAQKPQECLHTHY